MGIRQLAAAAVRGAVAARKALQKAGRTAVLKPLQSLTIQLVLLAINAYLLARSRPRASRSDYECLHISMYSRNFLRNIWMSASCTMCL